MAKIIVSVDESLLERVRSYASTNGMSLNELIRTLLRQTLDSEQGDWLRETFELADHKGWRSRDGSTREGAYDAQRTR